MGYIGTWVTGKNSLAGIYGGFLWVAYLWRGSRKTGRATASALVAATVRHTVAALRLPATCQPSGCHAAVAMRCYSVACVRPTWRGGVRGRVAGGNAASGHAGSVYGGAVWWRPATVRRSCGGHAMRCGGGGHVLAVHAMLPDASGCHAVGDAVLSAAMRCYRLPCLPCRRGMPAYPVRWGMLRHASLSTGSGCHAMLSAAMPASRVISASDASLSPTATISR